MPKHTPKEQLPEDRLNAAIARDIARIRTLQKLSREELAQRAGLHGPETVEALEDGHKQKAHQLPQLVAVYRYLLGQQGPELEPRIVQGLAEVRTRLEDLLLSRMPITAIIDNHGGHFSS